MKNILREYDNATDNLAKKFVAKYFYKDYVFDRDFYWVGNDEDQEVLAVSDFFFNLNRIVDALRYKATKKQLFDYHEKELELAMKNKKMKYNFKNYIKLKS